MKIKEVLVRRDGKMVHGVRTAGTTIHFALCGCEIHTRNETHSIHDYDARFVINCKRCKKVMEKMRRGEEETRSLVDEGPARYIRNLNTSAVHKLKHPGVVYSICECGHTVTGNSLNYERLYGEHKVTCAVCLEAMGEHVRTQIPSKSLMENIHDEMELKKATVMDGKDIFYEVRLKDGSHEYVYDVMSAQEAAEIIEGNMGIPLTDIECIHKLAVVKVIFPTVTVKFEE